VRVAASKAVRVAPGDEITIRGQLPASSGLGRLFVFASEGGARFSPYVKGVSNMAVNDNGQPFMLTPLTLRLVRAQPTRQLTFVADIDGFIKVMQEVDDETDPRARVKVMRRINPKLGWKDWITRCLMTLQRPTST
jgi:hypothetical protein